MTWKWKLANKTEIKNERKESALIGLSNGYKRHGVLVGWANAPMKKSSCPKNALEINRYFALPSYCNTIGQSNNAFSILGFSLAGKRRVRVLIFLSIGWQNNKEHLPKLFLKVIRKSLYHPPREEPPFVFFLNKEKRKRASERKSPLTGCLQQGAQTCDCF